ncbi:phosphatase PAP2 family protein [Streptomyces chitinivorans]|uniref:Phosphatase PAP2 family protein n=1 Tax=Streptomyces chitinivorans TaxID=1257027 RepID=A0ABW7HPI6_9ACTN|nr:phosphatase PAP2 family protein [Streptomyces chitinivorans]MDH2409118.1 phosphatase PAP2 family protein [Streptomyces chitinivorans]
MAILSIMARSSRPSSPPSFPRSLPCLAAQLCTAVAAVLTVLVLAGWDPLLDLDAHVTAELHRTAVAEPGWTRLNRVLTDWVWDPWTMRAVLLSTVVWLVLRGARRPALWLSAAAIAGTVLQQVLKALFDRDRPRWSDPVDSASFAALPSGHAMTAALTCGLLLWLAHLRQAGRPVRLAVVWVGAVSVAGVGFTRVYLGVHWPTDVVVGWLLGFAVAAAAAALWSGRGARPPRPERHGPEGSSSW